MAKQYKQKLKNIKGVFFFPARDEGLIAKFVALDAYIKGGRTSGVSPASEHEALTAGGDRSKSGIRLSRRDSESERRRKKMTVGAGVAVQDGGLVALGATVLTEVRDNVLLTPAAGAGMTSGTFVGVRSANAGGRSVFPVGKLRYVLLLVSDCQSAMDGNYPSLLCLSEVLPYHRH